MQYACHWSLLTLPKYATYEEFVSQTSAGICPVLDGHIWNQNIASGTFQYSAPFFPYNITATSFDTGGS